MDRNAKWEDPKQRELIVKRATRNSELLFNQIKGFEGYKFEVHENNKKFQNKDARAEFDSANRKIRLDISKIDEGSLPHEIGHITLKALFKSDPEISNAFARELRGSFPGKIGTWEVKDKNGIGTGVYERMNLEEFIKNEYQERGKNYDNIKSEEFVSYVIELLASPKYYSKLVQGKVFTNVEQKLNRFYNQKTGKDLLMRRWNWHALRPHKILNSTQRIVMPQFKQNIFSMGL